MVCQIVRVGQSLKTYIFILFNIQYYGEIWWTFFNLFSQICTQNFDVLTADQLAQLVERRTTVWEVSGSSPRPDQHSGS